MNLNYIQTPKDLGGAAVPDCGTIHRSEIVATLDQLSHDLDLPFNLNNCVMGSTGKREYSGDIDLVLDQAWWTTGSGALRERLESVFGKDSVARNSDMVHLKYPIVEYNSSLSKLGPRTGFVQVDFVIGDHEWEKFYHYSAGEKSAYKSAHRNLMISAICAEIDVHVHVDADDPNPIVWADDQPVAIVRWKWGPKGFFRVIRRRVKDRHGHWSHKKQDTVIAGPYFTPDTIIDILFPGYRHLDQHSDALDSVETIMKAVTDTYGMVEQEKVWRRSASNFFDWSQGKLFFYPEEISQYLDQNDK